MKIHTFNKKQALLFLAQGYIIGRKGILSKLSHVEKTTLTDLDKEVLSNNFYRMDDDGRIFDRFNDEVELSELPCQYIYFLAKEAVYEEKKY